jgi:hypothetical protein
MDIEAGASTRRAGEVRTGAVCRLAEVPADITAEALIVTKGDTQAARGRWRLQPDLVDPLPPPHRFLASGRQHGEL